MARHAVAAATQSHLCGNAERTIHTTVPKRAAGVVRCRWGREASDASARLIRAKVRRCSCRRGELLPSFEGGHQRVFDFGIPFVQLRNLGGIAGVQATVVQGGLCFFLFCFE